MPDHVDQIVQAWRRERPDLDLGWGACSGLRTWPTPPSPSPWRAHGLQPGWFDLLAPSAAPESPMR
jgi:hypothetical protein